MTARIVIVYNEPIPSRYDSVGEEEAIKSILDSVVAVRCALLKLGYQVKCMPLTPPFESAMKRFGLKNTDLVFNLFEGFAGQPETEAMVPAYLASIGVPFTGSPATALSLCLNKAKAKLLLQAAGLPTPAFQLINPDTLNMFKLSFPCVVKPNSEDASHGINEKSVVADLTSLRKQVQRVSVNYGNVLVEEFIGGREFNVTIMGNSQCIVLPVAEIIYPLPAKKYEILTFATKWEPHSAYYRSTKVACPADITAEEQNNFHELSMAAFKLMGCRGYARIDMRMTMDGQLNIIEVNPNPDIFSGAGTARQARAAGISYTDFIHRIIKLTLEE